MTDSTLNRFLSSGTNAERLAFTPSPPTPGSGPDPTYIWHETDTGDTFAWDFDGAAWDQVNTAAAPIALDDVTDVVAPTPSTGDVLTFDGSDWVNDAPAASGVSLVRPGGRLTLVSATPVLNSDQTAKSSIYYTPYQTDLIPIYSGSAWSALTFTELTLALDTTNHLANTLHDIFVWNNSGTVAVGAGPAWTFAATVTMTIATPAVITWTAHGLNEGDPVVFTTTGALPTGITAGTTYFIGKSPTTNTFNISTSVANAAAGTFVATSGSQSGTHTATNATRSRGTGAGTTELQMKNGIWTNKNSITLTNGAGAGTSGIAANTATYVGTFYCTANGQTGMALKPAAAGGGTANILGVYNAYNRINVSAVSQDNTMSWAYAVATIRPMNNNVNNRISFVDGLAQSFINSSVTLPVSAAAASGVGIGLGINSTNTADSYQQTNDTLQVVAMAQSISPPLGGFNYIQAVECPVTAATAHFFGSRTAPDGQEQSLVVRLDM